MFVCLKMDLLEAVPDRVSVLGDYRVVLTLRLIYLGRVCIFQQQTSEVTEALLV